jgi:hypothetical protein
MTAKRRAEIIVSYLIDFERPEGKRFLMDVIVDHIEQAEHQSRKERTEECERIAKEYFPCREDCNCAEQIAQKISKLGEW